MNINKRFGIQKGTNIKRLLTVLANTKTAATKDGKDVSWNSIYQTFFGLINGLGDLEDNTGKAITSINNTINGGGSGGGGGGGGIIGASYATVNPEVLLPNSRQLIAGPGISLIDSGTTLQISAGVTADYVVMSDGGIPNAQPLNDGAGQFIYTPYIP